MKTFFKTHAKLCIAVLALLLVTVGGTLALMVSNSAAVTNIFSVGQVDTEIQENLTEGNKQVSIYNKGPSDAYVRARIMVSGVNMDQVKVVDSEQEATDPDCIYLVMQNPANWQQYSDSESDDFYYYLDVLNVGEKTSNLLEKVVVGENLQTEDFLKDFTVTIYHESVLAVNQPETIDVSVVKSAFDAAQPSATP
ncbi:hypothetical protein [Allofournierella sp. CML151]|uniref:hypothetical protein n=1 Tax=Allofournierella sp. CML151 TaxID=2998082 RepID=UPI0022EBA224|nr:hypothetical protein [Fournierella sp. CML151]